MKLKYETEKLDLEKKVIERRVEQKEEDGGKAKKEER